METKYTYCELLGSQKLFSSKLTIRVDYGQEKGWFQDLRIKDENGKVETFNSMVDGLNYMGSQGWDCLQAYVVTTNNNNVYHWLQRKKV